MVVGPEVPLCNGVVDALNAVGILAYGPDAAGRVWKEQSLHQGFSCQIFDPDRSLWKFFGSGTGPAIPRNMRPPCCGQASGLAAGKGVLICESMEDARDAVEDMLSGESFGESGKEVVIEEFLDGRKRLST